MTNSNELAKEFDKKVTDFQRNLIQEQLKQCTPEQMTLFNRMYKSIDKIKPEKMRWAYCQCKRTVQDNEKEKSKNG